MQLRTGGPQDNFPRSLDNLNKSQHGSMTIWIVNIETREKGPVSSIKLRIFLNFKRLNSDSIGPPRLGWREFINPAEQAGASLFSPTTTFTLQPGKANSVKHRIVKTYHKVAEKYHTRWGSSPDTYGCRAQEYVLCLLPSPPLSYPQVAS